MTRENSSAQAAAMVQKLRSRVAALREGAAPKRLTDRQRLVAASHVGRLVQNARDGGRSMSELCEMLGDAMRKKSDIGSGEPFRLHRWMLKKGVTEVSADLLAQSKGRPEPLRSTSTYLQLIHELANIAGQDPLESQGALLRALDLLDGRLREPEDEFLPEVRLADLLHEHAAVVARRLDLARLFQKAEQIQAGWNIQRGPDEVVDLVREPCASFRAREPVDRWQWLESASPPLPSVSIARLPFGFLPGPFRLTKDNGESQDQQGHAVAYWELHLAIGPTGPLSVGSYLLRGTSVDLTLGEDTVTLPDQRDDIEQLVSGNPHPPRIVLDGETWEASSGGMPFYRTRRRGLDEDPPSEQLPSLRIDPVSPSSVKNWLMSPLELVSENGIWADVEYRLELPWPAETGWIRAESIASRVEAALRDGRLEASFRNWLDRFRPALNQFEQDWIDRTREMDTVLRQRFAAGDLTEETTHESQ